MSIMAHLSRLKNGTTEISPGRTKGENSILMWIHKYENAVLFAFSENSNHIIDVVFIIFPSD